MQLYDGQSIYTNGELHGGVETLELRRGVRGQRRERELEVRVKAGT